MKVLWQNDDDDDDDDSWRRRKFVLWFFVVALLVSSGIAVVRLSVLVGAIFNGSRHYNSSSRWQIHLMW